jgi:hypothetical protein
MSDASPGEGWWQAADGRWYPPELRPAQHLMRDPSGATILVSPDQPRIDEDHDDGAGSTGTPPAPHEEVGGSIHSHADLYLGRPAGKQNRPAAWTALAGAVVILVGALLPWATRSPAVGVSDLGWRDASGEFGAGLYVGLLAVTVMTVAVRCMAGSYGRGWRLSLVGLALGCVAVVAVEAVRIQQAVSEVKDVTRGQVELSFGPGLIVVVFGALVVLGAAAAYRVGPAD